MYTFLVDVVVRPRRKAAGMEISCSGKATTSAAVAVFIMVFSASSMVEGMPVLSTNYWRGRES